MISGGLDICKRKDISKYIILKLRASRGKLEAIRVSLGHVMDQLGHLEVPLRLKGLRLACMNIDLSILFCTKIVLYDKFRYGSQFLGKTS